MLKVFITGASSGIGSALAQAGLEYARQQGLTVVPLCWFARSYIDPNRHEHDIDPTMLADAWPGNTAPTARTLELGMGLVPSHTPTHQPIYARRLSAQERAESGSLPRKAGAQFREIS